MRARETAEADLDEWACCGQSCFFRRGDDAFTISMDGFGGGGGNGKRSGYSAVTIVEVAVSSVPALSSVYEVKHFERPQHVRRLRRHDVPGAMLVLCGAAFVAMVLMFWVPVQPRDDVLHSRMHKLQASISSPLYLTSRAQPLLLALADNGLDAVVDVRLLAPCLDLDCGAELAAPDGRSNTRRFRRLRKSPAQLAEERRSVHASTSQRYEDATWVEWALEAGGATCASRRLALAELEQTEAFATVDVRTSGCAAEVAAGALFQLRVSTDAPGGLPVMAQAIKMGPIGRARVGLASALLGLLFVALHFEWMHRVYSTFVAAILALGLLSLTRNLPPMAVVVGFVDSGTIMLTFAMSVNVHLLALTGFFDWVTAKMVELSGGSVRRLFFLLTNMTGVLSALLDNVVVVLLLGPITIKLCEQLGVNPLPLYLTQTLAATLGGTATLLGDPLNVMLGSKLGLSFADFIIFNAPLMIVAMPAATAVQYYRMRHTLGAERVSINVAQLRFENRIYDERSLLFLAAIFVGIFLGLILTHFHGYEGAWFCALGMLGAAITTSRYDIRHAMGAVEWDALLFFCALFVFVGALEELGARPRRRRREARDPATRSARASRASLTHPRSARLAHARARSSRRHRRRA
jgi:Na+/H+ antiporter NhaD/arsenite permease-like protein